MMVTGGEFRPIMMVCIYIYTYLFIYIYTYLFIYIYTDTILRGMKFHKSQLFWCLPGLQGFEPWRNLPRSFDLVPKNQKWEMKKRKTRDTMNCCLSGFSEFQEYTNWQRSGDQKKRIIDVYRAIHWSYLIIFAETCISNFKKLPHLQGEDSVHCGLTMVTMGYSRSRRNKSTFTSLGGLTFS